MATIEFYDGDKARHMASVIDAAAPRSGEMISIRGVAWRVDRVTWAVDDADEVHGRAQIRACVVLTKATP